jgi:hypothetical protein
MTPIQLSIRLCENPRDNYNDWEKLEAAWVAIRAKYPRIFVEHDFGTNVGAGWWELLEDAFIKIEAVLDENPSMFFKTRQIKEKFGGLRFYYDMGQIEGDSSMSDEQVNAEMLLIHDIVVEAESKSNRTCEVCGEPGAHSKTRWVKTLCTHHEAVKLSQESKSDHR